MNEPSNRRADISVGGGYCLNKLYNEDCLTAMAAIPDKFFQLAIVDPHTGLAWTDKKRA